MDGADLRCSLKNRYSLDLDVIQGRSVPLRSPGYDQPIPFYHNYNFCIYNVSLDCPGEVVHLQSKSANYSLEDYDKMPCQDYLWFNTSTSMHQTVDNKICGDKIGSFNATVNTQSFIGILWSNGDNSEGRFEIEARCTGHPVPVLGSGSSADAKIEPFQEEN